MSQEASAPLADNLPLTPSSNPSALPSTPRLLYGTAWKQGRTTPLVLAALRSGFRGIDTAAQPLHYREDLVGAALQQHLASDTGPREPVFVQTKFSPNQAATADVDGPPIPYPWDAPLEAQVDASIASSLAHLGADHIDMLLLHAPLPLTSDTLRAWHALEAHAGPDGPAHRLGVSNVSLPQLEAIFAAARVKPSVVQNRFRPPYDVPLRAFCRARGVVYQSFWTLTANAALVRGDLVGGVAAAAAVSREVVTYCLVMALGVCVLDGTTREEEMRADLAGLEALSAWAEGEGRELWAVAVRAFKVLVGDEVDE
ncbi:hypothetical protein ACHAQA_004419 [Verticillium albo-atrum]